MQHKKKAGEPALSLIQEQLVVKDQLREMTLKLAIDNTDHLLLIIANGTLIMPELG